jgi:hypothetical protein
MQGTNMDSQSYLALNAWLQKADNNYIEGRLLWLNHLVNGASNLLWLASEQIIKILLLQKEIEIYSQESEGLDQLHKTLDKKGKKLGHNVDKLIKVIGTAHPDIDVAKFSDTLKKLQEYFYRRYVVRGGSSMSMNMLDEVDEFYFLVRSKIHSDVGLGTIDQIHIQRKRGFGHPLSAFSYAYINNNHFKPRIHREINIAGPDGTIYKENGNA